MAEEDLFDPARLERIERRLQVLEDAEAIRNLKARYSAMCDNQYDPDVPLCATRILSIVGKNLSTEGVHHELLPWHAERKS
jgi:hypothetical protein